ncbi:MAG: lipid carrier--UDP-N-acetylgalactosaminyltransferase [Bacteroidetes bacterium]|nr:MAG: lipid carrier--UDP-N-acetylgalactosaminyltransferase [Bacteroidota bacterium]
MYKAFLKYIVDFILALLAFIVLSPVFALTVIFLCIANRGSVFFIQERPGKDEKPFFLIKFKTMSDCKDPQGNLLSDSERLTTIGLFVRKLSLDEMPQLLNVIRGDMSLIGPRPLLMEYLPLYSEEQKCRHDIRPGITGWAQVNGRNSLEWKKKFEYDIWYVQNYTVWVDIKILFMTVFKVLRAEGISSESSVTMEKFKGNIS